jgi:hypothetical protein
MRAEKNDLFHSDPLCSQRAYKIEDQAFSYFMIISPANRVKSFVHASLADQWFYCPVACPEKPFLGLVLRPAIFSDRPSIVEATGNLVTPLLKPSFFFRSTYDPQRPATGI